MIVKTIPENEKLLNEDVAAVLTAMSNEDHLQCLTELGQQWEERRRELESSIINERTNARRAATEILVRAAIFEKPDLKDLEDAVANANARIQTFQQEMSDIISMTMYCRERKKQLSLLSTN